MKRLFIAAIAVAFGLSSAALAQTQPIPTAIAPGGQTITSTPTAIMIAPAGGGGGKGTVVSPDSPLPVTGTFTLPTGGATAANQVTGNTSLGSIDTKLSSQATAAKQDTSNTWLSGILTNTTGVSTAAKQDTGNTSLGSIDTKLSSQATAANQATANGSLATIVTNTTGAATAANQAAPQANAGSDATKATAVQGITGGKLVGVASQYVASGVTPVSVPLTSVTCTSAFVPIAGRGFNVSGWGTFVATYQLVRSFDGGTTKLPITAAGTQLYQWTVPASEQAEETEFGVSYYVCTTSYTSGTLNVRLSQ